MAHRLPIPPELQHLLEKRQSSDRRNRSERRGPGSIGSCSDTSPSTEQPAQLADRKSAEKPVTQAAKPPAGEKPPAARKAERRTKQRRKLSRRQADRNRKR